MPASEIAVSIRNLSKAYTIAHDQEKHSTLAETILSRVKHPLRRAKTETFWALKDVSFDIKKGEVVGIIGRNGAGKSTLLKVLSRITEPTTGEIELWGKVGSLLEVGTGFHPELTGRENVYLNGAILGMPRSEIRKQFDAIVDFAGVEQFLDTPVKRYSSGMYVRLAFAVAAHLSSDILIVDEVLAVGDAEFQKKCLGKMKDVSSSGEKTVLFVSHNVAAIAELCTSCVLLGNGKVVLNADTRAVIGRYLNDSGASGRVAFDTSNSAELGLVFSECKVLNRAREVSGTVAVNEPFSMQVRLVCHEPVDGIEASIRIDNATGIPLFTTNLSDTLDRIPSFTPGEHVFHVDIPGHFLAPDLYSISLGTHRPGIEALDLHPHVMSFEVAEVGSKMARYSGESYGVILVSLPWTRRLPS